MPALLHVQFGQGALDGAAFRIVYYLRISEKQDMCDLHFLMTRRFLNIILERVSHQEKGRNGILLVQRRMKATDNLIDSRRRHQAPLLLRKLPTIIGAR
jgi:hypothetical protein